MALDQEQLSKVNNWMRQKGVTDRCPACGNNTWSVSEIVSAPIAMRGGGIQLGGRNVPVLQLVCNHCMFIMQFAAVPMGLIE